MRAQTQANRVQFAFQALEPETLEGGLERNENAVSVAAQPHTLEFLLAQIPVAQHADHLQPEMIHLDALTQGIAARKQLARSLGAKHRNLGVAGIVILGNRATGLQPEAGQVEV